MTWPQLLFACAVYLLGCLCIFAGLAVVNANLRLLLSQAKRQAEAKALVDKLEARRRTQAQADPLPGMRH